MYIFGIWNIWKICISQIPVFEKYNKSENIKTSISEIWQLNHKNSSWSLWQFLQYINICTLFSSLKDIDIWAGHSAQPRPQKIIQFFHSVIPNRLLQFEHKGNNFLVMFSFTLSFSIILLFFSCLRCISAFNALTIFLWLARHISRCCNFWFWFWMITLSLSISCDCFVICLDWHWIFTHLCVRCWFRCLMCISLSSTSCCSCFDERLLSLFHCFLDLHSLRYYEESMRSNRSRVG